MKRSHGVVVKKLLLGFVIPLSLIGSESNEEVAIILKNEQKYSVDDLIRMKEEFIQASHYLFDTHNSKMANILQRHKDEIVQELTQTDAGSISHGINRIVHQNQEIANSVTYAIEQNERISQEISDLSQNKSLDQKRVSYTDLQAELSSRDSDSYELTAQNSPSKQMKQSRPPIQNISNPPPRRTGWEGHRVEPFQNGATLDAEFLYWTVLQDGLHYALSPNLTIPVADQGLTSLALGNYQSAKFGWRPGVRIGSGYKFSQNNWLLFGEYTYFHSSGKNSVRKPSAEEFVFPAFTVESGPSAITLAQSKIRITYQTADLLLSRNFIPADYLFLKLSMGMTGVWVREQWNFAFLADENTSYVERWQFNGGGIRVKLDNSWLLGGGFSIFNYISGGMLIGHYHYRNTVINTDIVQINFNPLGKTSYENTTCIPTSLFALGLNWCYEFTNVMLSLGAAGEITTLYDLHQIYNMTTHTTSALGDKKTVRESANVNFCGVSFKLGFDF